MFLRTFHRLAFRPLIIQAARALVVCTVIGLASDAVVVAQEAKNGDRSAGDADRSAESFDVSDYFRADDRDGLSELLRQLPGENSRQPEDARDDVDEIPGGELSDDEPTDSLLDDESEDDDEDDDAAEALKIKLARRRALVGHLERLHKPLSQISLVNAPSARDVQPINRAAQLTAHVSPQWISSTSTGPRVLSRDPVAFCHGPLYFQQIDLERCGQHHGCLQNALSAAHFLCGVAVLPFRLATECPADLVRSRGDCRSGYSFNAPLEPLVQGGKNPKGVLVQAASLAGFTFLLL